MKSRLAIPNVLHQRLTERTRMDLGSRWALARIVAARDFFLPSSPLADFLPSCGEEFELSQKGKFGAPVDGAFKNKCDVSPLNNPISSMSATSVTRGR
jgi:hypothetical protein